MLFAAPDVVVSTSCKYSCYEHKRKFMKYFVPQMMFPKQIYSYEYINRIGFSFNQFTQSISTEDIFTLQRFNYMLTLCMKLFYELIYTSGIIQLK